MENNVPVYIGKLMAAISQTKLMIASKYDAMATNSQDPSTASLQCQDASARLERIAKSLTSNYSKFKLKKTL